MKRELGRQAERNEDGSSRIAVDDVGDPAASMVMFANTKCRPPTSHVFTHVNTAEQSRRIVSRLSPKAS